MYLMLCCITLINFLLLLCSSNFIYFQFVLYQCIRIGLKWIDNKQRIIRYPTYLYHHNFHFNAIDDFSIHEKIFHSKQKSRFIQLSLGKDCSSRMSDHMKRMKCVYKCFILLQYVNVRGPHLF